MIGIGIITTNNDLTSELTLHLPKAKVLSTTEQDAKGKNELLKQLMDCDYIFLVYDYMKILDESVFARFILVSEKTGFECMGYGKSELSNEKPIFEGDPWVTYWAYPATDFVFYTKKALEIAGLMNEGFPPNTWEDVEHIKRMGDYAMTAPIGHFIGIKNEDRYLAFDIKAKEEKAQSELKRSEELKKGTIFWQSLNPEIFPEMPKPEEKGLQLKKAKGAMI